jgi:tetratricopeptide (TPR) repeat protein
LVLVGCSNDVIGVVEKVTIEEKNENSFAYQMKQADAAMLKGDMEIAERYYLNALELDVDNIEVRLKLAELYMMKKDTASAEKYLKEVLKKEENYSAYKILRDIYAENDDMEAILALKENIKDEEILKLFSDYIVNVPELSLKGGTYDENVKILIIGERGTENYYTLDGTDPKTNGIEYNNSAVEIGSGTHTLKVVSKNKFGVYSEMIKEIYAVSNVEIGDPVVTPNGGKFAEETYISIEVPDGCSAYYTWDRTEPTKESTKYTGPFLVLEGRNTLSVIIINDETSQTSVVYCGVYEYIK